MIRSKAVDVLVWLAVLPVAAWAVVRTAGWTPVWQWVPLVAFTPYVAALSVVTLLLAAALRRRTAAAVALVASVALAAAVLPGTSPTATRPPGRRGCGCSRRT
ncbi:hypothetical protein ACQP10_15760 [Streptosporangium sandarakinum]|uniref:hypothetical protein n=1 Tax=Streptosporangium sandarakinum TaxID=1260955 RepID=UPI003D91E93D